MLDKQLLANPIFLQGGNYEQDKVRIVADCIQQLSVKDLKETVHEYIDLVLRMWQYGFSEVTFNWDVNCGFDSQGNLVQVDFGEIVFCRTTIGKVIRNNEWIGCSGDLALKNKDVKKYCRAAMNEHLSPANLAVLCGARNWGIAAANMDAALSKTEVPNFHASKLVGRPRKYGIHVGE